MQKLLPIGISDFKEIRQDGYSYIDKSLFIQELIEKGSKVSLIPRLSALQQIVDKHYDQELIDRGVSRIMHLGLAFYGKRVLIRGVKL